MMDAPRMQKPPARKMGNTPAPRSLERHSSTAPPTKKAPRNGLYR